MIVKFSRYPHAETVTRLSAAIVASGTTVFATLDQAAAAREAGLSLRPTTLILFGNPKAGTPLMEAFPLVALDLPLKILVWEESGSTRLAYTPMSEIAKRYDVNGKAGQITVIDHALDALTNAVASNA